MWVRFPPSPMTNVTEFQRESRRIDQLIWDAMSLVENERVLFCGSGNDAAWVRRAIEVGVSVTVIESNADRLDLLETLDVKILRGSTTMIPARNESFDAVVAFHYLHEIDPTFHALTVSELARVGKRVIVVEPAPPSDLFGKRIAELYSRAKYEAGAFEEYQPVEYWRKLLAIVKGEVLVQQFTFTRIAPRFLISDTIDLILDAMAISDMPQAYIDELRDLARRTDTQLSPLSRYVLVAVAGGDQPRSKAGTLFRPVDDLAAPVSAAPAPATAVAAAAAAASAAALPAALDGAEFPPVLGPGGQTVAPGAAPPAQPAPQPSASPAAPVPPPPASAPRPPEPTTAPAFGLPAPGTPAPAAGNAPFGFPGDGEDDAPFGLPAPAKGPGSPLGTPFALPDDPDPFGLEADPERRPGAAWSWEPPEDEAGN
jgi:ubiquinone/menaquinone biosynthesis C-methylase UbiE